MLRMNEASALRRASDGFVERAQQIASEQWHAATPCVEWNVRALVNHVAGEYLWLPEMLAGKTVADVGERLDGDLLGNEPVQTLINAQRAALAAVEADGALDMTVHLSFGDLPASVYAMQMIIDSTIHSWDLARAIGADETLDSELVEIAYAELQQNAEEWREGGAFGPKRDAADDSTQAKLLALTGR
jgi:uncharacterized protein (TIGR03086 family)